MGALELRVRHASEWLPNFVMAVGEGEEVVIGFDFLDQCLFRDEEKFAPDEDAPEITDARSRCDALATRGAADENICWVKRDQHKSHWACS